MARTTPQDAAKKWSDRLGSSTQLIQQGIQNVTVSPTQKAAAKQQKMLTNLTAAVNSGKWAAGLNRVSLSDWQNAAIQKGLPRIAQGALAAQPKMADFLQQLFTYQDSKMGAINAMPDTTLQENIARMVAWTNAMAAFKRK